jgi:FKBP-type peptidyl-prolyl cis-trans isomerase SlyD
MQSDAGETRTFYVTRIADGRLTVDGNHPLAGKRLRVRIRIQDVREPSAADVQADAADDAPATNPGTLH